jgi:selenocysteine-specific elongation factor
VTVVIGTAGHIDHGKTALLRALTGIDADRLPEERRRGMTIDVGYAHLRLPDGAELDFVDVPGHDRLVGNMLVGAGEVQAALLVVAADDGPRAQTIEHLGLLDGLAISAGIAVVTKIDLVEPERAARVGDQVRELLAGTSLQGSPVVQVSATDGTGLAELADELVRLRDRVAGSEPPVANHAPIRLAIDRAFVVKGRGAVVTGSLRGGRLARGDVLRLVPGDRLLRAREVQVHGRPVDAVVGGGRVAINLAAIDARDLPRGAVLTTDPLVVASRSMTAVLRPAATVERPDPVAPGAVFRLHLGTDQVEARVGRGRFDLLALADGRLVARLRLGRPVAIAAGDRFVLRRTVADRRVVGGLVVDPDPPFGPSRRRSDPGHLAGLASNDPIAVARALVGLHGVLDPARLPAHGSRTSPDDEALGAVRLAGRLVAGPIADALAADALAGVAGPLEADVAGISRAELRARLVRALRRLADVDQRAAGAIVDDLFTGLTSAGRLERDGDRLQLPGRVAAVVPALAEAMDRLEQALTGVAPLALADALRRTACPPDGLRALEASGRIVRVGADLAYAGGSYRDLARVALRMAALAALTPAAFRDETGTSRKYVLAILEDLDRRGILRRTPEGHRPGPRAALVDDIGRAGS